MSDDFHFDDDSSIKVQRPADTSKHYAVTNTAVGVPVIVLRSMVVFPGVATGIVIGRKKSLAAIELSTKRNNAEVLLLAQRDESLNDPSLKDIYTFGVLAKIVKQSKYENNSLKIVVESISRACVNRLVTTNDILIADIQCVASLPSVDYTDPRLTDILIEKCTHLMQQSQSISSADIDELMAIVRSHETLDSVMNHVAFLMTLRLPQKQELLETVDIDKRFIKLMEFLNLEKEFNSLKLKVEQQTKKQLDKNQRDYYLNEKLKAIKKEMHDGKDPHQNELDELEKKIIKSRMPKHAREQVLGEIKKLRLMPPMSSESTVIRNYVDILSNLPWKKKTRINYDLTFAQKTLEDSHCGLQDVKDSILEFLAVNKRVKGGKSHANILCLVGPPGVGKTSIAESIARACSRKFERIALGGLHDEAEIRGHRRTYIGAMPGKIIQKIQRSGVANPLILLDEVDKIGKDYRGDPAAALLEVLDPEQNKRFVDNYLEVEFDLSSVMFICTANSTQIPEALLDRMELIRLSGYTEQDKLKIAEKFLFPKQKTRTGIQPDEITIQRSAMKQIIRHYTRESGVRELERKLNQICRKVVRVIDQPDRAKSDMQSLVDEYLTHHTVRLTNKKITPLLGVYKYHNDRTNVGDRVGQIYGLAWTQVGGELLDIQVQLTPAAQTKVFYTGSLGDVMKESVQAALTVAKLHLSTLDRAIFDAFKKHEIHVHFPSGATPKDGPSAGIGLVCALVSSALDIPIFNNLAVTGEIDISGNLLPIGGLQEKLGAAVRYGVTHVIIPKENSRDLQKIPQEILDALTIHKISHAREAWSLVFKDYKAFITQPVRPPIVENVRNLSDELQVN